MATKYLRQKGSGHIYISTPLIAGKKDMVEYDPDVAAIRIGQLKKKIEAKLQVKAEALEAGDEESLRMKEQALELTELEEAQEQIEKEELEAAAKDAGETLNTTKPRMTDEEVQAVVRNETIDKDPQVLKIRAMSNKNEVEAYVLQEWGQDIDRKLPLNDLKSMAEMMRVERLFED